MDELLPKKPMKHPSIVFITFSELSKIMFVVFKVMLGDLVTLYNTKTLLMIFYYDMFSFMRITF